MDLEKRLDFLGKEDTEKVICIFEDALLILPEHREVVPNVERIPSA